MTLNCNLHFKCADQVLPKKSGQYLCIKNGGFTWQKLEWSNKHQRFNASDLQETPEYAIKIMWWAELPKWAIS